jgi:hypothetical protein
MTTPRGAGQQELEKTMETIWDSISDDLDELDRLEAEVERLTRERDAYKVYAERWFRLSFADFGLSGPDFVALVRKAVGLEPRP